MASLEAVCSIRLERSALHEDDTSVIMHQEGKQNQSNIHAEGNLMGIYEAQAQSDMLKELIARPSEMNEKDETSINENTNLFFQTDPPQVPTDISEVPLETRLEWIKAISELFLKRGTLDDNSGIRDWDIVLKLDGSVLNQINNDASPSLLPTKAYPTRYRIPDVILEQQTSNKDKVQRAEIFALGCLLYEVLSGKKMFAKLSSGEKEDELIQAYFIKGQFPEDVWELPKAVRILGCWCPRFAKDLLAARNVDESYRSKVTNYVKQHPVKFGFQVLGGIALTTSFVAIPILGAIGFGAAGPVAGSAAAAWQSSIGLVEAGSFFAWCQSAAMGGAAVGGILATGLAGAGVAVGATIAGALDNVDATELDLKEKFLAAWKRDIGERGIVNARL